MKKLTAGIFAGILSVVTVGAASAADLSIATTTYVKEVVGDRGTDITDSGTGAILNKNASVNKNLQALSTAVQGIEGDLGGYQELLDDTNVTAATGNPTNGFVTNIEADDGTVTYTTAKVGTANLDTALEARVATGETANNKLNSALEQAVTEFNALATDGNESKLVKASALKNIANTAQGKQDKLGSSNVSTTTGNGMVKTVSAVDGVVTATRGLVASDDLADAVKTDIAAGVSAKGSVDGAVTTYAGLSTEGNGGKLVTASAVKSLASDLNLGDKQDKLTGTNVTTSGDAGVLHTVTATDGTVTFQRAVVASNDLADAVKTDIAAGVSAKGSVDGAVTTYEGLSAEGNAGKLVTTDAVKSLASDLNLASKQDKLASAHVEAAGGSETGGVVTGITAADGKLTVTTKKIVTSNMVDNTIDGSVLTDGTVTKAKLATAVQTSLDNVATTGLQNKLLTVNTSGALADAAPTKPDDYAACTADANCSYVLMSNGSGFEWVKIINSDSYSNPASQS